MLLNLLNITVALLFVGAAYLDAKTRSFPNWLFALLLIAVAVRQFVAGGVNLLAYGFAWAFPVAAALYVFELLWRRYQDTPGIGMGDIKALGVMMVMSPFDGLFSFVGGLFLLAIACLVSKRASLPLLPFAVPIFLLLEFVVPLLV